MSPEKLEGEMYLANGDTSRRGTINLCQKHRSGQCGGATTRAVPRFVAGNCLSARETSRWNFPTPSFPSVFFDTLVILLSFQKEFFPIENRFEKRVDNFENGGSKNFTNWNFPRSRRFFFLRIERISRGKIIFPSRRGKRVEGGLIKESGYPREIATTRRYLW